MRWNGIEIVGMGWEKFPWESLGWDEISWNNPIPSQWEPLFSFMIQ